MPPKWPRWKPPPPQPPPPPQNLADAAVGASATALRETAAASAIVSLRNMVVLLELRVVCAGLKFSPLPISRIAERQGSRRPQSVQEEFSEWLFSFGSELAVVPARADPTQVKVAVRLS